MSKKKSANPNEVRAVIVKFSPHFAGLEAVQNSEHHFKVVRDGVPADAKITGAGYDYREDFFWIRFEHPSFNMVPGGGPIPFIVPNYKKL
jgi:hypothetical protein